MDSFSQVFKTVEDDLAIWMVAIVMAFYVFRIVLKNKSTHEEKYQVKNTYDKNQEYILDLEFNNSYNANTSMVLAHFVATLISFFIGAFLANLSLSLDFGKSYDPSGMAVFGASFLVSAFILNSRTGGLLRKINKVHKKFVFKDVIFTPDELKMSPFLFNSKDINPSFAWSKSAAEDLLKDIDYKTFQYGDLKTIVVRRKEVAHADSKYAFTYFLDTHSEGILEIDRAKFFDEEQKFLDLLQSFSSIHVAVEDGLAIIPQKKFSENKKIEAVVFLIVFSIVMIIGLKG